MISFDTPTHRFHLRAAAIINQGGSVLLHCLEGDDFWSLPGGRVEPGEAAAEAVVRELQEELGISARVDHLSLLVENFFTHSEANHHEVGLYFSVHVDSNVFPEDCMTFEGQERFKKLLFRWFPISAIAETDVRPAVLKEHLLQERSSFRHVVHRAQAATYYGA